MGVKHQFTYLLNLLTASCVSPLSSLASSNRREARVTTLDVSGPKDCETKVRYGQRVFRCIASSQRNMFMSCLGASGRQNLFILSGLLSIPTSFSAARDFRSFLFLLSLSLCLSLSLSVSVYVCLSVHVSVCLSVCLSLSLSLSVSLS